MSNPASWISSAALDALGWALIHFIWQGAALAAVAAAALSLCRSAPARYLAGLMFLILMLAAPLVTFLDLLNGPLPGLPFGDWVQNAAPSLSRALPLLVQAWLLGVALFSLRFGGGFLALEWRCRAQTVTASCRLLALCREVEQRLGIDRAIRYLECDWLEAPAGIGAFKPVILFPLALLSGLDEDQLRAVIAHELAHVRRWDFAVNLFQVISETILFYHPAIWWLNRRIRAEREICCDEIAVAATGNPAAYARALARLAEWKQVPDLAMAASHGLLTDRILRLLGRDTGRPVFAVLTASLILLFASLAGGGVLLGQLPLHHAPPPPRQILASLKPAPLSAIVAEPEPTPAITRRRPAMRRVVHIALPRTPFPVLPPEEKVATAEAPVPAETPNAMLEADAPADPVAANTANDAPAPDSTFAALSATEPKPIVETHTPPYYRFISLFLREQGTTLLEVALDATGKPTDVWVGNSSGSIRLDNDATRYVKEHWRWRPATRGGKPVAATILVDVVWDPKNGPLHQES